MKTTNLSPLFTALLFLVIVPIGSVFGQNLVPNGDFEAYSSCPQAFNDFEDFVDDWFSTSISGPAGTPDYFNACNTSSCSVGVPANRQHGFAPAQSGHAYAGMLGYYLQGMNPTERREYISVQLSSPLEAGEIYQVQFYAMRATGSHYSTQFGATFSNSVLIQMNNDPIDLVPNILEAEALIDTTWQEYTALYEAAGGEEYITFGNFNNGANTNLLEPGAFDTNCEPTLFNDFAAYYYLDNVSVIHNSLVSAESISRAFGVELFPNPTSDRLNINISNTTSGPVEIRIVDITGKLILSQTSSDSRIQIVKSEVGDAGCYIIEVLDINTGNVVRKRAVWQ
jgi:hypothetical protein